MITKAGKKPINTKSSFSWDPLLKLIERGRVVPVIGPDLLVVEIEGRPTLLYRHLAKLLAQELEISTKSLPNIGTLNEVALRYMEKKEDSNPDEVCFSLASILDRLLAEESFSAPEPLRQLAGILPFKLFVTTTIDPLLVKALDEVRYGGSRQTHAISYPALSRRVGIDLGGELNQRDPPVVFHLFGQASDPPFFAITEEDTLEVLHVLQSNERSPKNLLAELAKRHILLIGNRFPDWVARFFLRVARGERLWLARTWAADLLLADEHHTNRSLVSFLQRYRARTHLYPDGPVHFVAELARRWKELHPAGTAPPPVQIPLDPPPGAVFVSYASEDEAMVEALCQELKNAGVDLWFDRHELKAGERFRDTIRLEIENCSVFMPVISRHVLADERRFFRWEWSLAEDEFHKAKLTQTFVVPVLLEDLHDWSDIPAFIRDVHRHRARPGEIGVELPTLLRENIRRYRRNSLRSS